jgi:hypothetical protein
MNSLLVIKNRLEPGAWAEHKKVTKHNVCFPDRAHFHSGGITNKQNVCFWASGNSHVITKKMHHALKITVGVTISTL